MRSFVWAAVLAACSASPRPTSTVAAPPAPAPAPAPTANAETANAPVPAATAATVKVMAADTPWADADGNTFIVPEGWSVATSSAMTVVFPPEGNSHIAFVDSAAASNDAARDAAWKAYKPDATWCVLRAPRGATSTTC
jgi:hypothetical protein